MKKHAYSGFTLVEIMIVVAIIGLLAAIGIPGYMRARRNARVTCVANNLVKFSDAFLMYCMDTGLYPIDTHIILPPGMVGYIQQNHWDSDAFGGHYNWEGPVFGEGGGYTYAGIALDGTTASIDELQGVDRLIDDGDLSSGLFLLTGNGRYTYIIESQ